ncbi:MAG: 4-hydroxy-3-methylbut-2-enyl diphosphate reductase [candidate division WOR-3 bacterium]|nr:MAG: 4-hydroxy-3-methylbut-2-enyl diphosphate reductase [candidate division WOR-3 bacterium]
MNIIRAKHGGVCVGVERAIRMALEAAEKWKHVYSLGPLIHNRVAVEDLRKKGIITVDKLNKVKNKKVIIRSHGAHPTVLDRLKKQGFTIIDATCPRVRRAQRYVEKLIAEGYYVIIVGQRDHPEVKGLLGYAHNKAEIYSDKIRITRRKIGVVPQTTLDIEHFNAAVAHLMTDVLEMKIYNTICHETIVRIKEAKKIAKKADVMIVVGGKNSANTTKLYQICKKSKPSYHIEFPDEVSPEWFTGVKSIGITAGASTPKDQVDSVEKHLRKIFPK